MPATINNPAARLLSLINQGKSAGFKASNIANAWCILLNVSGNDHQKILNRIGYVISIPDKIEEQIKELGELSPKIYLKYINNIKWALHGGFNYQQQWSTVTDKFTREVMDNLEVLSDVLSRNFGEKTVENEELKYILDDIDFLMDSIQSIAISNELRNLISDQLIKLKSSIEEYPICGIVPIQQNLLATITQITFIKTDKETESVIWKRIAKIAMIVGIVSSVVTIAKNVGPTALEYIQDDKSSYEQPSQEQVDIIVTEVTEV